MQRLQQGPSFGITRYLIGYEERPREWVAHAWSSIITFDAQITDAQLLDLAKKAYEEMTKQFETCKELDGKSLEEQRRPKVMTALLGPCRKIVIFASSMKRFTKEAPDPIEYVYNNPQLRAWIDRAVPTGSPEKQARHRTGACGEIIALGIFLRAFSDQNYVRAPGLTVVTWGITKENTKPRIRTPCSRATRGHWRCYEVLAAHNILPVECAPNSRVMNHPGF